jgi:hypothetical protein
MLDFSRTRPTKIIERQLLSTVTLTQEGLAMQGVMEGGIMKVRPTNGTANTIFTGISFGERFAPPANAPMLDAITVAAAAGTLSRVCTGAADVSAWFADTGASLTRVANPAAVDAAGKFCVNADNKTLTFAAGDNGKAVVVSYRYELTVAQAQAMYGDAYPGPRAANMLGTCGVIVEGIVYTDQFDTAVNWAAIDTRTSAETLVGVANGRISVNATGTDMDGFAFVYEAPTVGSPFLGLELRN